MCFKVPRSNEWRFSIKEPASHSKNFLNHPGRSMIMSFGLWFPDSECFYFGSHVYYTHRK